ncbi:MAG: peptide chain release factor N(5)-glutamine methyltransferase [Bacteroidetes bacterium]|nr:peptide chain release factor N(5)-glutamine methyltransferase [Bacteroidota bacterium]
MADVIQYYKSQLNGLYYSDEIQAFIRLSFEFYLGISPAQLMLKKEERISESELLKFNFVVKGLKIYKPIQYILGETEFYGLKFKVNPAVLIPRPETEELVDWIIKDYKHQHNLEILDACTGSGCIAIALNKNLNAVVDAIDISSEAIEIARENVISNQAEVKIFQADVLDELKLKGQYDIIVSNPPYVTGTDKMQMHPNVLDYEPHLALFVDDSKALVFYEAIAKLAKRHLKDSGSLYFEINEAKGGELIKMLSDSGYKNLVLKKDFSGKDRMIKCDVGD